MKKFNIKDYKGKYAMFCENIEQAEIFCKYLDSVGKRWTNGDRYIDVLKDLIYEYDFHQGVFYLDEPEWDGCKEVVKTDYQILNFLDFDWEEMMAKVPAVTDCKRIEIELSENDYVKTPDGNGRIIRRFTNNNLETTFSVMIKSSLNKDLINKVKFYKKHELEKLKIDKGDKMIETSLKVREECLEKAKEIVCKGREQEYGSPEDSFESIAKLWTAYLDYPISAKDVAMLMILLKTARAKTGRYKDDNFIDIIGYAACACEIESHKRGVK